jgi:hypothetical protein
VGGEGVNLPAASIGAERDNLTKRASGWAMLGLPEMMDLEQVALFS